MTYKIISDHDSDALSRKVNACLQAGWEVHGSLLVEYPQRDGIPMAIFHQAMINPE